VRPITDLDGLLTRENAEDLLVVPSMTLALLRGAVDIQP
jgi:hypothetical protein